MTKNNNSLKISTQSLFRHDVRSKLTGIKAVLSFILEGHAGTIPAKSQELLQRAYQANEEALQLIAQLDTNPAKKEKGEN